MKLITVGILALSSAAAFATSVTVTNVRGPIATRSVVDNTGASVTGFGAFGILSEGGIMGLATTFEGLNFQQFGTGSGPVTTANAGQFSFSGNVPIGASAFDNQNIYLVVGFGGADLATSTSLFIHKFDANYGAADSGIPITQTLSSEPGATLLGTENGIGAGSGTYNASLITVIPEPSSALLLGMGGLGLLLRRRR